MSTASPSEAPSLLSAQSNVSVQDSKEEKCIFPYFSCLSTGISNGLQPSSDSRVEEVLATTLFCLEVADSR